jgi:L-fuculose-phosphate aldolase
MSDTRDRLAAAARRLHELDLAIAASGNLSLRDGDTVLITPSGARCATVLAGDMVRLGLDGSVLAGGTPSSEAPFHLRIYQELGAGAVVHTHAHHGIVLSTLLDELPIVHYAMADFGGPVRVAPYATFGTEELAGHVIDALQDRSAALLANHGAVVTGPTIEAAIDHAELLEWSCALVRDALALGTPRALDADQVADYHRQKTTLRYAAAD